jgi:starvation-inducible DNA-binding protein
MSVKTKNGNPELVLGRNAGAARPFGTVRRGAPICLDEETRKASTDKLNQILVDTISLRDLYNKHYWQVSGPTFYQLHLLFDKHFEEQVQPLTE